MELPLKRLLSVKSAGSCKCDAVKIRAFDCFNFQAAKEKRAFSAFDFFFLARALLLARDGFCCSLAAYFSFHTLARPKRKYCASHPFFLYRPTDQPAFFSAGREKNMIVFVASSGELTRSGPNQEEKEQEIPLLVLKSVNNRARVALSSSGGRLRKRSSDFCFSRPAVRRKRKSAQL